ncbi:MAG: 16S rRNA (cytosine(1402)-N(4))-methyltransferase RsmH [Hydrogenophaga sp.]|uniref:16S rRNA (cytosine(1402)-N(4))-methyltransferase RsmH n=1 Tax=Hydrogenophaga sp. TaxID=1904254 RepID=UPI0025C07D68|nr:16S rRNA (cytosine(1402)-N(4))-methyltransferase RsmH [Hydrogenophaga sp.]MDO8887734.1 16S rRNA (cytosine(1402)-N(4))-methyltransferase RsmH [Hydrogenophaga sp.]MDO9133076.1 16S rRNA (cytosine(1402)-N(4))-methyltransferase RsmH [Hydrogenophaga sp.]MDO9504525.1 16S rRNA (cytosine(1402)-N(4))-methyltransferase RsmH [Hydrogenophaga sp.]MDP1783143.1 16S rRNA (cytosine(1402)-N(4))-methyltransferase RsmH [Hydrogenophaga sp.]MDP2249500.1 16S rRNA (cytosine(1402)-N(4))-methyltransferase RsmH [Hydro
MVQGTWIHHTVLLNEAVQALAINPDGHYVDATFGRGGHSRLILEQLSRQGRLTVFDKDPQAVEAAQSMAATDARIAIRHEGFAHLGELGAASVDGVLMDLGVSSPQIDDPERGFSFRNDGPLDMRMDTTRGQSVAQWLETADVSTLSEVIRDYGEERFAQPIAKAIDRRRQERGPFRTTRELAEIVAGAVKTREPGKDPATRTFQAFRIFINAELEELQQALEASLHVLRPTGHLVVISFHSLEDRMVKQFMARHSRAVVDRRVPFAEPAPMALRGLKRVMPSDEEVKGNPRSRSAVMRVAERTEAAP